MRNVYQPPGPMLEAPAEPAMRMSQAARGLRRALLAVATTCGAITCLLLLIVADNLSIHTRPKDFAFAALFCLSMSVPGALAARAAAALNPELPATSPRLSAAFDRLRDGLIAFAVGGLAVGALLGYDWLRL